MEQSHEGRKYCYVSWIKHLINELFYSFSTICTSYDFDSNGVNLIKFNISALSAYNVQVAGKEYIAIRRR
jgi:hypothetical protein